MRVELHAEARAELRRAARWYDERRPGLGDEFIAEIHRALERIGEAAIAYPTWPGTRAVAPRIHRSIVQRFPYLIAFEKHEEKAFVLAIAHAKRRPLYWLRRAQP